VNRRIEVISLRKSMSMLSILCVLKSTFNTVFSISFPDVDPSSISDSDRQPWLSYSSTSYAWGFKGILHNGLPSAHRASRGARRSGADVLQSHISVVVM